MTVINEFFTLFNIQTTVFLTGLTVLIQAGLIWFQAQMIRSYSGIRTAAAGSFLYGFGMLLTSFRGIIPSVYSIILANYAVSIGVGVMYMAVCKFLNARFYGWVAVAAVLPVLILFPYYTFTLNDFVMRVVLSSYSIMLFMGAISVKLFRLRSINFYLSARFLAFVSAVYTILLLARSIGFLAFPMEGMFSPTFPAVLHSVGLFAFSLLWSIGFLLMVSHRLQADLNELATVDSLTRVANRRAMLPMLEAEFSRFSRTRIDFSVLLVDVDHFKQVNDRYGHEMGDIVLRDIAQLMKNSLRKQDFISRWGGEEFLILLPNTTLQEAAEIGERLRTLVESSPFHFDGYSASLTVSIGIGSSAEYRDVNEIYRGSDAALYKAKMTRNAVAVNNNTRTGTLETPRVFLFAGADKDHNSPRN